MTGKGKRKAAADLVRVLKGVLARAVVGVGKSGGAGPAASAFAEVLAATAKKEGEGDEDGEEERGGWECGGCRGRSGGAGWG